MLKRLRERAGSESGFTLIELLVVMLILGILAAIAIPAFLNQKGKANDSNAKTLVRTEQTAMETFQTDHNTYTGATCAALNNIDKSIPVAGCTAPVITNVPTAGSGYTVSVTAANTNNVFRVVRAGDGSISRTCTLGGTNAGGCTIPAATAPAAGVNGTW
jgi:type IV pilus assembly protein PilA